LAGPLTSALSRGDPAAEDEVRFLGKELARALAVQAIVENRGADAAEYGDRLRTLEKIVCPADPLEGYALESSLGAFLVARLAMSWAPPSSTQLRSTALREEALLAALKEAGVEPRAAAAILGDWTGIEPGFAPDPGGLHAAELAGLAEKSLTKLERGRALSQAAYSPRCLARLAQTAKTLGAVRTLLPVLPAEEAEPSPPYLIAIGALALGRPERALEVLADAGSVEPELAALAELARAEVQLSGGGLVQLFDDVELPLVMLEAEPDPPKKKGDEGSPERRSWSGETPLPALPGKSGDDDDVLEVVEERIDTGTAAPMALPAQSAQIARPPAWGRRGWDAVVLDETFLKLWRHVRAGRRAPFAETQSLLGLRSPAAPRWVPSTAVPPDPRTLKAMLEQANLPLDRDLHQAETERVDVGALLREQTERLGFNSPLGLVPVVRAALRAVAASAEGRAPTLEAIAAAGDMDWALTRARALALVVRGESDRALELLAPLGGANTPEGLWAATHAARPKGEEAAARLGDARRTAARLVADLAWQFGRTVAGTLV
jgi:hypothetical protein